MGQAGRLNITKYLARRIAEDSTALSQAQSIINETGYEEQVPERVREWVHGHMSALLSPLLCQNPYPSDWLDWMQKVIHVGLDQVDWTEVVDRLRVAQPAS